jgi:hypothetical protein
MTKELELRWHTEQLFIELRRLLFNPDAAPPLLDGMTEREWYKTVAPRTIYYATEKSGIDCRGLNLNELIFGESFMNYVFDFSSAVKTTFNKTYLQNSSFQHSNLSGSRFIVAQMSPIYAYQANFSDCVFETCFLMGTGRRNYVDHTGVPVPGTYSDFRECNFTNVRAKKSAFERCEMQGANFSQAQFVDCSFKISDLTGVLLEGATFERCDFDRAWLDDTPQVRALVERGGNQNLDTIVWVDTTKR